MAKSVKFIVWHNWAVEIFIRSYRRVYCTERLRTHCVAAIPVYVTSIKYWQNCLWQKRHICIVIVRNYLGLYSFSPIITLASFRCWINLMWNEHNFRSRRSARILFSTKSVTSNIYLIPFINVASRPAVWLFCYKTVLHSRQTVDWSDKWSYDWKIKSGTSRT